jgi:hypothetical protein
MRVFSDTLCRVAITPRNDQWHQTAAKVSRTPFAAVVFDSTGRQRHT